jgi:pre-mRNA-splicing factor SYF1
LEGKSPYQLFVDFLELVENYSEEVGLDADEVEAVRKEAEQVEEGNAQVVDAQKKVEPASVGGKLMRFEGPPVAVTKGTGQKAVTAPQDNSEPYSEDTDPASTRRLDIGAIVLKDGLEVYKDQAGRLWTGLATYWIKRGDFEKAGEIFEQGMTHVVTIRDFTQIFDAYAEFSETLISTLMEAISDPELEAEEVEETETELDKRMKDFEDLMDRRPFMVNEVLLRRNPNEVVEWEKRVALYGDDDEKVSALVSQYFPPLLTVTLIHRSLKRTMKLLRRSIPARLSVLSTLSTSNLPSSTRRADLRMPRLESLEMRLTSTPLEKSSKKRPECRTRQSMSWLRSGANGQRWS